jgi:hypothetical protein
MTFGYSRDDVGKFLPIYLSQGILQHDPFEVQNLAALTLQFQMIYLHALVKIQPINLPVECW